MRSAAPKTYISRRMLDRYSEQRTKQSEEQAQASSGNQPPVVPPKTFAEDSNLAPIEEEKKEMEETKAIVTVPEVDQEPAQEKAASQKKSSLVKKFMGLFSSSKKLEVPKELQVPQVSAASNVADAGASKKKRQNSIDRNLSADELDSDELDGDLNLSDEDDGSNARGNMRARTNAAEREAREQHVVEFDTNIFRVSLECLQDPMKSLIAGDAEFCTKCKAVFNKTSKIVEEEGKQIWACEFCNNRNEVMIGQEEIPQTDEVTYLIEAAAQVEQAEEEKKGEEAKVSDKISVVFCIDISGSMQSGGRLTMCKQAIAGQINAMAGSNGQRKLGIVAFDHEVEIIGDGLEKPHKIVDPDTLMDFEALKTTGENQGSERLQAPICDTKDSLLAKVGELQVKGRTALGPAVLTSVAMASKGAPGSQVIICTDGMANVGIGAFGSYGYKSTDASAFYDQVGALAEEMGVMINLVTIAGTDANIEGLSRLVELSGGQIEQVNPNELSGDFANILSQKAIATKVVSKVMLHKALQFRNELQTDLSENKTILTRRFGNVTTDSMFTFDYGMKPISELLQMEDVDMSTLTHLPFQAQITFTAMNGAKCLRVISQKMEISNERDELTAQADAEMVQQNVLMQGSKQARAGNTRGAQAIMKTFQRRTKNIQSDNWQSNRADFQAQAQEVYGGMNMQAQSMKMPVQPVGQKSLGMRKSKMRSMQADSSASSLSMPMQQQSVRMDDRMASQMYQMSTKAKRSKY